MESNIFSSTLYPLVLTPSLLLFCSNNRCLLLLVIPYLLLIIYYRLLVTGCPPSAIDYWPSTARLHTYWLYYRYIEDITDIGYSILVIGGYSSYVIGYLLFVIGYWLLIDKNPMEKETLDKCAPARHSRGGKL